VIKEWRQSPRRLSEIEREHFGWDHAQASAWISQAWGFPEELVCYLAAHNLSREKINELELTDTVVSAIAVAAISPSVLKPDQGRCERVFHAATQWLTLSDSTFVDCVNEVKESLTEMMEVFGLSDRNATRILEDFCIVADSENYKEGA
jgi:HD-like signal output (HDOD) protein